MPSKPALQSKTVIFNLLSLAVLVATKYGFGEFAPDAWVTEAQAFINICVNWYLRVYATSQPIDGVA